MKSLLLASSSPRRRELLAWAGFEVTTFSPDVDEQALDGENPVEMSKRLATAKVNVAPSTTAVVVAADTIVHMNGIIFGKPSSMSIAKTYLQQLANCWHTVTTGVAIRKGDQTVVIHQSTKVMLRSLSEQEMINYLESGEGADKAGAYGIQGAAGQFVIGVEGSWTNVMGLPLKATLNTIDELD